MSRWCLWVRTIDNNSVYSVLINTWYLWVSQTGVLPVFQNLKSKLSTYNVQRRQTVCCDRCSSTRVIKSDPKSFSGYPRATRRDCQVRRQREDKLPVIRQQSRPMSKDSSNVLTPYRGHTRIVGFWPHTPSALEEGDKSPSSQQFWSTGQNLSRPCHAEIRKLVVPKSMARRRHWPGEAAAFEPEHPTIQTKPCVSLKIITLEVRRSLMNLVGRKQTVLVQRSISFISSQKPPDSRRLWFSRTRVVHHHTTTPPHPCHSSSSSSSATPDHPKPPKWCLEEAYRVDPQPTKPQTTRVNQHRLNRIDIQCHISWGWVRPYTRRKDLPHLYPKTAGFGGRGHASIIILLTCTRSFDGVFEKIPNASSIHLQGETCQKI